MPRSPLVTELAKLSRGDPNTVTESVHVVSAVRDDGRLDLQVGTNPEAIITGVPALRSYTDRQVGDRVVVRKRRRSWIVTGAIGTTTKE